MATIRCRYRQVQRRPQPHTCPHESTWSDGASSLLPPQEIIYPFCWIRSVSRNENCWSGTALRNSPNHVNGSQTLILLQYKHTWTFVVRRIVLHNYPCIDPTQHIIHKYFILHHSTIAMA